MKTETPNFRTDASGRCIFTIEHRIVAEPRCETREFVIHDKAKAISNAEAESSETIEDAEPDGWVRQKWRLISAVEAWPTTDFFYPQLVDYGHDGGKALADAVSIINATKPDLTWNHSSDVKDVAGFVDSAQWDSSSDIPPGINGELVVDPQFDAKAAAGLSKGLLRSGSIGVMAEMRRSHEKMPIEKFVSSQGEMIEGDKVRWLLERITAVRHMALVPYGSGADRNAGRRTESIAATHTAREVIGMNDDMMLSAWGAVCKAARIDVALGAGNDLPQEAVDKVVARLHAGWANSELYNELVQGVLAVGALISGEPLSADDVLRRLPEVIEHAKHGKDFLEFQREEALKWFDAAKVDPDTQEMPSHVVRMRKRISESDDLSYIQEMLEEYQARTEERFELNRSSKVEEIPNVDAPKKVKGNPDISSSAKRMFDRG